MKLFKAALALVIALCLLLSGVALAQEPAYALIDPIETSAEAKIVVRFRGEAGVAYALHHNYQGVWLQPSEVKLTAAEGQFSVVLGLGKNEFVLNEKGQPRDAKGSVAFSVELLDPSATPAAAPTAVPTAAQATQTAAGTPVSTKAPAATAAPAAVKTPSATEVPAATEALAAETPAPTPEATPTPTQAPEATAAGPAPEQSAERVLRLWASGEDVKALQAGLSSLGFKCGKDDGVYGPRTRAAVRQFQRENDLHIDGVVGENTREKLAELGVTLPPYVAPDLSMPEGFSRQLSFGVTGMDVYRLQERLIELSYLDDTPDQVYGKRTRKAVRAFQLENGLAADGVCGPETLRALFPQ